ncbi:hypothetical protein BGZ50_008903 [Haplosporangium sp. Z 11]|nr:hypothetical protein BGZ50_008903 [Haplosporangium sp. Z 11]
MSTEATSCCIRVSQLKAAYVVTVELPYGEATMASEGVVANDGGDDNLTVIVNCNKAKELNAVKYKRLDENKLPSRINSTVGGTDYFLSEIRNVVQSKEDVERL